MSGSFSGSFVGNGSGLTGVTATAIFPTSAVTSLLSTDKLFVSHSSGGEYITYGNVVTELAGTNLTTSGSVALSLATTITGITSISSTAFTGSLLGTSSYATSALSSSYALTASYASNIPVTSSYALSALSASYSLTSTTAATSSYIAAAITNNTDNRVLTATGGGSINGETNLTFDGSTLQVTGDAVVTGNLTVSGTATFINTTNTYIKDQFVEIASGSATLVDAGWVAQYNTAGSGSAFYLEAGSAGSTGTYGRFAIAYDVLGTATSANADEYMVTVKANQASTPSAAPTWGGSSTGMGNMWTTTTGDIYIYA